MARRVFSSKKQARSKEKKIWAMGKRARVIPIGKNEYGVYVDGRKQKR